MSDCTHRRWLILGLVSMIALLFGGEIYRHLIDMPAPLSVLLFKLGEKLLLIGGGVSCVFLAHRGRMRAMSMNASAFVVLLLAGEMYLGDKPATAGSLLIEVTKLGLLIGCVVAFLAWHYSKPASRHKKGRIAW